MSKVVERAVASQLNEYRFNAAFSTCIQKKAFDRDSYATDILTVCVWLTWAPGSKPVVFV